MADGETLPKAASCFKASEKILRCVFGLWYGLCGLWRLTEADAALVIISLMAVEGHDHPPDSALFSDGCFMTNVDAGPSDLETSSITRHCLQPLSHDFEPTVCQDHDRQPCSVGASA